jgi:hypothetical protein
MYLSHAEEALKVFPYFEHLAFKGLLGHWEVCVYVCMCVSLCVVIYLVYYFGGGDRGISFPFLFTFQGHEGKLSAKICESCLWLIPFPFLLSADPRHISRSPQT